MLVEDELLEAEAMIEQIDESLDDITIGRVDLAKRLVRLSQRCQSIANKLYETEIESWDWDGYDFAEP